MIGLIIPPPEIKSSECEAELVEKTAEYVAKNGSEFEERVFEEERGKLEFSFLEKSNPYRAYYDYRVAEFSKLLMQEPAVEEKAEPKAEAKEEPPAPEHDQQALIREVFEELKEPERKKFIAEEPDSLNEIERAVIQHTAQFVARHGKSFLGALSEREKNNPQFEFLKSTSASHGYFSSLAEAYAHLFALSDSELLKAIGELSEREAVMKRVTQAVEYYRMRREQGRKEEQESSRQKEVYIDWNDFELVETIVFEEERELQPELLARIQRNAALLPRVTEEQVVGDARRREVLQQCHVCKNNILASELNRHLKTCLGAGSSSAPAPAAAGSLDIQKNMEGLVQRRPDIFGAAEGEAKADKTPKIIWDGQSGGITRHTSTLARISYQQMENEQKAKKQSKAGAKPS